MYFSEYLDFRASWEIEDFGFEIWDQYRVYPRTNSYVIWEKFQKYIERSGWKNVEMRFCDVVKKNKKPGI